jgi:hypothetical protein
MRNDGIASLKEALAQAGIDSRPSYVAPRLMAERFRHRAEANLATNFPLETPDRPRGKEKTWLLVSHVLISALLAGAFLVGKKSRVEVAAPCCVETRSGLLVTL